MKYLALIMLFPFAVHADSVQIHLVSEHSSGCDRCNERNIGIGWRGSGDIAPTVGYYDNSHFEDSLYAGMNFRTSHRTFITAGVVSGYSDVSDKTREGLLPLILGHFVVAPSASWSPMVTYAPTQDGGVALLSLNLDF